MAFKRRQNSKTLRKQHTDIHFKEIKIIIVRLYPALENKIKYSMTGFWKNVI